MFGDQKRFFPPLPSLSSLPSLVTVLAALLLAPCARTALGVESLGKSHVDKKLGFSIRVPKGWSFVASPDEERYIVAKFIARRNLQSKGVEWGSHRPEMRIIAFTPENKEIESEKRELEVGGRKINYITRKNPYRDFREYVKRTVRGFYFGDEKEDEIRGVPCTYLDVIMEQARPPLRRSACIFHLGDVDVAAYFEVMEEWYPKYETLFRSSFKSFKRVRRDVAVDESGPAPGSEKGEMTREDYIKSKTENLPAGWTWKVSKRHLVISHADKKYTDRIASFADAIRATIEKEFKSILASKDKKRKAKKEEAFLPIIRICGSAGEFNSYCDNSGGFRSYNAATKEVVTYDGTREGYPADWAFSRVSSGIYWQYMDQILPLGGFGWYVYGMGYYFSRFKRKGSGCRYVKDTGWSIDQLRQSIRKGECRTLKDLLSPESKGIRSWQDYLKVGTFICFLKGPEGRKKPWRGLDQAYLVNMKKIYEELMEERKKEAGDSSSGDGKEEKKDEKKMSFSRELRKRVFDAVFGGWTDKDWDKLEKAWTDWAV